MLVRSPWISNGFDGVLAPPVHPPFPLSKWTEFEGAAEAAASKQPPAAAAVGSHRFGSLSYNSFFSRHNPHPVRVTHLKGLLDMPICVVNDDGYLANPRYALHFPPNNFVQTTMNRWEAGGRRRTPGSGLISPNTSNGLQSKLTKKRQGNGAWGNKHFSPYNGMEAWRDELKMLTDALMKASDAENVPNGIIPHTDRPMKRRPTQYSAETGRIIPASSLSRGRLNSRKQNTRSSTAEQLEHIIEQSSSEVLVLQLLGQILETEDVNEVQKWLTTAPDRERSFAFELLKMALSKSDEDQLTRQHPFRLGPLPSLAEEPDVQLTEQLPPVDSNLDSVNKIDRLIIDHQAEQENKNDSKSRALTEVDQSPCKAQKHERPTQLQCKMSTVCNVKKDSFHKTGSNQTGLQKNNVASKAEEARPSRLRGKETPAIVSEQTGRALHQSHNRSTHEPGLKPITKLNCRPTFKRAQTII